MKFLIDAQLPPALKQIFITHGYDCIHTLDLELQNETPDHLINSISIKDQRILITKDDDFYNSFIIKKMPYKLILVKLGNTSKNELLNFFSEKFMEIIDTMRTESILVLKAKK